MVDVILRWTDNDIYSTTTGVNMFKTTLATEKAREERVRQIESLGYDSQHDQEHEEDELAAAAFCYVFFADHEDPPDIWPWEDEHWKPRNRTDNLTRAVALLLAELDRHIMLNQENDETQ